MIELEKSLLGGILAAGKLLDAAELTPEDFAAVENSIIFRAMLELKQDKPIDLLTVSAALKDAGKLDQIGGLSYLSGLCVQDIPESLIPYYVKEIQEARVSGAQGLEKLVSSYGLPYYVNDKGAVHKINESHWAALHQNENIQLFEPTEKEFYRYKHESGLYAPISIDAIKQELSSMILNQSRKSNLPSLELTRINVTLNQISTQLKGISEKRNAFHRSNKVVHLANKMIDFKENREGQVCDFSPAFYSRNQSPIAYDPSAKCERFLNELLLPAMSKDDAILFQKYAGLCLLGSNLIQRFLILDGHPGRGKTQLVLTIQKLIGETNTTDLRTQFLNERFELFRYLKKTLLTARDVPGDFLSQKGAQVIKGLVGGDPFDAEKKGDGGSFQFHGNFCILITSNSRLRLRLDGDVGAWKRRMLIIRANPSNPPKKISDFSDILIKEEGSGILNWSLGGIKMVLQDIENHGDIFLTQAQQGIVESLLTESDSLRQFLQQAIIDDPEGDLTKTEIVEAYAEYCPARGWNPLPITEIERQLKGLMLEIFKTTESHSIKRNAKYARGYRKVGFKDIQNEERLL